MNTLTPDQIAQKGQQLYEERLKPDLEPRQNGKFVVVEVETGEYFIGESILEALQKAKEKHPEKLFHTIRIGYPGVFKMGSSAMKGFLYGW